MRMFKQLAISVIFCGLSSFGFTQGEDDGFTIKIDTETQLGNFTVDAPKEKLQKFLIPDSEVLGSEFITSSYEVDFKKAGITHYFGLRIKSMSVDFDGVRTAEGELSKEDVYKIRVLLELPASTEEEFSFTKALEDFYGTAEIMFDPFYEERVRLFWWSEITMFTVHLGVNIETGEDQDFFEVNIDQGYGG